MQHALSVGAYQLVPSDWTCFAISLLTMQKHASSRNACFNEVSDCPVSMTLIWLSLAGALEYGDVHSSHNDSDKGSDQALGT